MRHSLYAVLALLLAAAMLIPLSACGKKTEPEETTAGVSRGETTEAVTLAVDPADAPDGLTEEEFSKMTAEDLLARIKDPDHVTAEEFLALVSTLRFAPVTEGEWSRYEIDFGITGEALDELDEDALPEFMDYFEELLKSPYPQVRGYAYELLQYNGSDEAEELGLRYLAAEEDVFPQYCALEYLSSLMLWYDEMREFTYKMTESPDVCVRASAANNIGAGFNTEDPDAPARLIELMDDAEYVVRRNACVVTRNFPCDPIIDKLVSLMNDPEGSDLAGESVDALCYMWVGAEDTDFFPNFDPAMSKRAFQETMAYYSKKPRTKDSPNSNGLFVMTLRDDETKEWAQTTDLIDVDQVYDVLTDLILDPDAATYARQSAIETVRSYCTDEQYEQLGRKLEGLTGSEAELLRERYSEER